MAVKSRPREAKEPSMATVCVREIITTAAELRDARRRARELQRLLHQQLSAYRALTDDAQPWESR